MRGVLFECDTCRVLVQPSTNLRGRGVGVVEYRIPRHCEPRTNRSARSSATRSGLAALHKSADAVSRMASSATIQRHRVKTLWLDAADLMHRRREGESAARARPTRHQLFNFAAVAIMPCTSLSIAASTASTWA